MTANERARRALELFDDWVDLPVAQRQAQLGELAARDPALHAEVKALLDADAADGLLERDAESLLSSITPAADAQLDVIARRIGPWHVTGILGAGGMGAVYRGERVEGGFQQLAAIKLIRIGMDHPDLRKRFLRERQILARLRHPNIAALLDGGVADDGAPYFAMELVQGDRITRWCDMRALDVRGRVRVFLQVLDAVAFAHRQLVVHRDLKPSNILVDANGKAFLLDFGIAKLMAGDEGDGHTRTGERAFTPEYASPEQLHGEAISAATDLYQLGVLLYALLAQSHPYGLTGDTPLRTRLTRMDGQPQPLWEAARQASAEDAACRDSTPTQLASQLRGDLTAIARRCLENDPKQRYESVDALRTDLIAWLDGRAVAAQTPSFRYRASRFLRRHAMASAAAAVAVVALVAGTGVSLWQAGIARKETQRALQQQRLAERQAELVRMQVDSSIAVQELLNGMFARSLAMDGGTGTSVRDLVDATRAMGTQGDMLDGPARAQLLLRLLRIGAAGDEAGERAMLAQLRPLVEAAGATRPRLLAQLLDVQLTLAEGRHGLAEMQRLAPPLLRLLDALPQPLDEEMLQLRLRTLRSQGRALDQSGRFDEALASKRRAWDATVARYGAWHRRSILAKDAHARALTLAGRHAEAAAQLRENLRHFRAGKRQSPMDELNATVSLVEALRQADGGSAEALRLLQSAEATARQHQSKLLPFYVPWLQALQADLLREEGDLTAAAALLRQAAAFRPNPAQRESRGVGVVVLTAQSDLAWAKHDAAAAAGFARDALALLGTPASNDNGDRRRALGLRLRLLRAQAATLTPDAVRAQADAIVSEWDDVPTTLRAPYLTMAAETLRLGGMAGAATAMARRAAGAADAEREPSQRRKALAREQLRLAAA
ncbi:MAG TPA: serine/threonine-protein kinase [Thermomonas sp.]|nr:serine/threonine-protein kinase [Thermomonas sp.]